MKHVISYSKLEGEPRYRVRVSYRRGSTTPLLIRVYDNDSGFRVSIPGTLSDLRALLKQEPTDYMVVAGYRCRAESVMHELEKSGALADLEAGAV